MHALAANSRFMTNMLAGFICALTLGLAACERDGSLEQAGEEADETLDTIENGGEESTGTKVDDAIDEAREGAREAADELRD